MPSVVKLPACTWVSTSARHDVAARSSRARATRRAAPRLQDGSDPAVRDAERAVLHDPVLEHEVARGGRGRSWHQPTAASGREDPAMLRRGGGEEVARDPRLGCARPPRRSRPGPPARCDPSRGRSRAARAHRTRAAGTVVGHRANRVVPPPARRRGTSRWRRPRRRSRARRSAATSSGVPSKNCTQPPTLSMPSSARIRVVVACAPRLWRIDREAEPPGEPQLPAEDLLLMRAQRRVVVGELAARSCRRSPGRSPRSPRPRCARRGPRARRAARPRGWSCASHGCSPTAAKTHVLRRGDRSPSRRRLRVHADGHDELDAGGACVAQHAVAAPRRRRRRDGCGSRRSWVGQDDREGLVGLLVEQRGRRRARRRTGCGG